MSLNKLILLSFGLISMAPLMLIAWQYWKHKLTVPLVRLLVGLSTFFVASFIGSWTTNQFSIWFVYSGLTPDQQRMVASGFPIFLVFASIVFCYSVTYPLVRNYLLEPAKLGGSIRRIIVTALTVSVIWGASSWDDYSYRDIEKAFENEGLSVSVEKRFPFYGYNRFTINNFFVVGVSVERNERIAEVTLRGDGTL